MSKFDVSSLPDVKLDEVDTDHYSFEKSIGKCVVCQGRALLRCALVHPNWFTPKTRRVSLLYTDDVYKYIQENTPDRPCVEVLKVVQDTDDWLPETETDHVCKEHLRAGVDKVWNTSATTPGT